MLQTENIIWQGKPRYKFRWAFLEIFGGGKSVFMIMLIPPLLVGSVFGLIWAHNQHNYLLIFLLYLFIAVILFGPELHKYIRRKNTSYQVTENYIIIQDYWYGKKKQHIIGLLEVVKYYLENYQDNCGVIHIFMKERPPFYTRDFWSGNPRFHITFEDIYPADEVFSVLQQHLKDWKRRNGI